jgi:hypothetical protein
LLLHDQDTQLLRWCSKSAKVSRKQSCTACAVMYSQTQPVQSCTVKLSLCSHVQSNSACAVMCSQTQSRSCAVMCSHVQSRSCAVMCSHGHVQSCAVMCSHVQSCAVTVMCGRVGWCSILPRFRYKHGSLCSLCSLCSEEDSSHRHKCLPDFVTKTYFQVYCPRERQEGALQTHQSHSGSPLHSVTPYCEPF